MGDRGGNGTWEGLTPPYSTIVADPPWTYEQGGPTTGFGPLRPPPYTMMKADEIEHSQTLTWCKPRQGIGPGGAFSNTTEFVLYCRRGSLPYQSRSDTTWWAWPRGAHSAKPYAFLDVVEQVSPGPYVELFARQARLGWDAWGYGHETEVAS